MAFTGIFLILKILAAVDHGYLEAYRQNFLSKSFKPKIEAMFFFFKAVSDSDSKKIRLYIRRDIYTCTEPSIVKSCVKRRQGFL